MNHKPARPITEADIRTYENDGAICLRGMFDPEWCERMFDASMHYTDSANRAANDTHTFKEAGEKGEFTLSTDLAFRDEIFADYRDQSPAGEIGGTLMRSSVTRFFNDQLFIKKPDTATPTRWHQDSSFWRFQGGHVMSIWLALTPVTNESSGVQYLKGSHRWGKTYQAQTPDGSPYFANPEHEPCPNFSERENDPELTFLSWDMEPGVPALPRSGQARQCAYPPRRADLAVDKTASTQRSSHPIPGAASTKPSDWCRYLRR